MGFLESVGISGGFFGINMNTIIFWGGIFLAAFTILIFSGAIIFYYYSKKANKISYKNQIPIFMEINGKRSRIGLDWAREIFVPDSNISLFHLKNHKLYLARPTRPMGKNEYWYSIAENGEWINFDLSTHPSDNTLSRANYDHRDTRYAYINLKEIIKRNYKDKTLVWWKDPVIMNIISYVIMSIIFCGGCWLLLSKLSVLIGQIPAFLDRMDIIADKMAQGVQAAQNINSGVMQLQ